MTTPITTEKVRDQVRDILSRAGEHECMIRRTKSTGRLSYLPWGGGYRLHLTYDGILDLPDDRGPNNPRYVGVDGGKSKSIETLKRISATLEAAGIPTKICGTHRHKSVKRVWVMIPIDRVGNGEAEAPEEES